MNCCGTTVNDDFGDIEAFYPIKPDCREDVPQTRFKPKTGKTLSAKRWHSSFSEEGYLDMATVLKRIQRGGVHPSIKGVVWEFLLGCYDPRSTFDERSQLRHKRRSEYEKLKSKCQEMEKAVGSGRVLTAPVISEDGQPAAGSSIDEDVSDDETRDPSAEQEMSDLHVNEEVVKWKLTLHQIGLDVVRTDRTLVYYENQSNQSRLWDVLAVYSWIDRDIGYCQGMSDLCSPIIMLVENEADAFWCFEHLMRRLRGNFKCTSSSIGVRSQLTILASIVKTIDPALHQHLESLDGGEYLFAFRMLMVLFRREFSFVDAMYLWELMWAMEYNPNLFHMYEADGSNDLKVVDTRNNTVSLKQYGKFERKNVKSGVKNEQQATLSIFLAASVLEAKNKRLLMEAKGLDDVVKILNDITGNLDAKKACYDALKLQNKYLSKVKVS
ncbi:TBC1 domain family member 15-like isoform X2 [Dioscorea cayenensis subsp. rotundata]|uniref:TBC1 domain family member 15-like isoform X2 n=1 Tax=Dioscorea cayennensis subsp. rotundata TaxID=55577 RepID=A0AB40AQ98_DIOCR|nr:TBC1 domain family member 15-like isoform X2 [Dioscorea cayenensis subsp. rotundata]